MPIYVCVTITTPIGEYEEKLWFDVPIEIAKHAEDAHDYIMEQLEDEKVTYQLQF